MSTAAGVDIWEGGNMKEQHIRERCQYLVDSIYGPQADRNMGASYDEHVQEAVSLYREAMWLVWVKALARIKEMGDLHRRAGNYERAAALYALWEEFEICRQKEAL